MGTVIITYPGVHSATTVFDLILLCLVKKLEEIEVGTKFPQYLNKRPISKTAAGDPNQVLNSNRVRKSNFSCCVK